MQTNPETNPPESGALADALTALEDVGNAIKRLSACLRVALAREDREPAPAPAAAPAPRKTRPKKVAATTPEAAPPLSEPVESAPATEPPTKVRPSAQELDAAIVLALQPPGVPIPSGLTTWDSFPSVEPDDSVSPQDMRELIKRLMAATAALHAVEGLQVVRGSLAAVGALRLAEVPDWQLLNLRSAVTHGNIDLRVQIASGEL